MVGCGRQKSRGEGRLGERRGVERKWVRIGCKRRAQLAAKEKKDERRV